MCPNTSSNGAASGGKEATAKPSKTTDSKVPALDYVDIHSFSDTKGKTHITIASLLSQFQEIQ